LTGIPNFSKYIIDAINVMKKAEYDAIALKNRKSKVGVVMVKVNKIIIKIKISPKKTKNCNKRAFLKTNPLNANKMKAKKARKI